jgi:predicted nucleotide-binding protein
VGLASIVARKKLVPIGSFGGASRRLVDDVVKYGDIANKQTKATLGSLSGPWARYVLDTALYLAGVTKPPKILIIHGLSRDRENLELWLTRNLELSMDDVVVMVDKPSDGRTLPEKFEDLAAEVDAAIAIATPDDAGGSQTEAPATYKPRARQNVWLEVGWLWGRLGRDKVMVLSKGGVEIPSDLHGLEYVPYTTIPSEAGERIREFVDVVKHGGRIQR